MTRPAPRAPEADGNHGEVKIGTMVEAAVEFSRLALFLV